MDYNHYISTTNEPLSSIHHGFDLARDLESNLPNVTNQPEIVSKSLDEIIRVLGEARARLQGGTSSQQDVMMSSYVHVAKQQQKIDASLQEWLTCNVAMDDRPIETQRFAAQKSNAFVGAEMVLQDQIHHAMDHIVTMVSHAANSNSQRRPGRRKDNDETRKLTVPAPRIGNTEIPPEDGFTWRKYGQKDILGCRFPRSYYKCTHQKLYNCQAKKQVQKQDNDPLSFEVSYRGDHTCHKLSTAPSIPPPYDQIKQETMPQTTQPLGMWLSMDFNSGGEGSNGGGGHDVNGDGLGTSITTTSTSYRQDVEFPVIDLGDAMFDSGRSSSNSMEFMFTLPRGANYCTN